MVGIAQYANVVSFGLGTVPDFDASRVEIGSGRSYGRCFRADRILDARRSDTRGSSSKEPASVRIVSVFRVES